MTEYKLTIAVIFARKNDANNVIEFAAIVERIGVNEVVSDGSIRSHRSDLTTQHAGEYTGFPSLKEKVQLEGSRIELAMNVRGKLHFIFIRPSNGVIVLRDGRKFDADLRLGATQDGGLAVHASRQSKSRTQVVVVLPGVLNGRSSDKPSDVRFEHFEPS